MDTKTDLVTVTEKEIPSHLSRYCETTQKLEFLVDVDKKIWVTEGVPVKDENSSPKEIQIPNSPHVFMVHDLWLNDKNHKDLLLMDVPVIFAHGYRDNETWRFSNGQSVKDTVEAYNQKAKLNNSPTIELVLSCNEDNTKDDSGIKIKDLSDRHIVQAVGEVVSLHIGHGATNMSSEGRVAMTISVEGEFWGVDDLATYKAIGVDTNIDQPPSK